ncbi:hypothetical protein [Streptomyces sp. HNM0574]|uniref:hypothetical protein n=1 Tax=Streptomyces sp. HNM0574 TaxID=2714954 RepID=UPI00146B33D2|nr:hypothetical protein [Streptomyces sp. HNM0574]NLU70734.1 hypothetical protein [Streptomyces sp. HNM0574]
MKLRHVRAVAVVTVVLVALTGARRSGGGSCDDSSSSTSSSSTGDYDSGSYKDDDYDTNVTTGGSSGGTRPSPGPTTAGEQDVRITDCVITGVSETEAKVTWKYTVTNGNSGTEGSDYNGTFTFEDSSGSLLSSTPFEVNAVTPGTPYRSQVEDTVHAYDGVASLSGRCKVSTVLKTPVV